MPLNVLMPALSPTMTEGKLAKWVKKEGDKVKPGMVIAEIETDKATMEVEAVDEGTLGKILVPEGTDGVAVNTPIAVLLEEGEDAGAITKAPKAEPAAKAEKPAEKPADKSAEKPAAAAMPAKPEAKSEAKPEAKPDGARVFASPLARRIAKDKNIDLANIKGSGPHGRIVKADLDKAPAGAVAGKAAPAAAGGTKAAAAASGPDAKALAEAYGIPHKLVPNSGVRKVIARRLSESKQTIPHFYLTVDCELDALLALRKQLNDAGAGVKLSVNDFVIKATAVALEQYPAANVSWTDEAIVQYERADISVAVATPNGLITPIIVDAGRKSMKTISTEMKDLAARAKDGKLKPQEFQGGTISVSNLGMFGIREFSAIINPPQGAILAVGAGEQRAVIKDGEVKAATVMTVTLSVDHRCIDGAVGAEYLQVFKKLIENPMGLLL